MKRLKLCTRGRLEILSTYFRTGQIFENLGAFLAALKTGLCGDSGRKSASLIYFWSFAAIGIVLLPKKYQFKISDSCVVMGITLTPKEVPPRGELGDKPWPPAADTVTAQGIGGARSGRGAGPQAMRCGGTPATPGFLRSKKCAQMNF
jgi:hypothetical protein